MKNFARFVVLFFFLCLSCSAFATTLTGSPSDSVWVQTDEKTQVVIGAKPLGNPANTNPSWSIAQWYSPVPFKYPYSNGVYGEYKTSGKNWSLSNSASAISYDITTYPWLNGVYQLSQSGIANSVSPGLPCGAEYDMFLQPIRFVKSQPLSKLTGVWFNLGLKIVYEKQGAKCASGYNAVSNTMGVILHNIVFNKYLFYQIVFRDSKGSLYDYSGWTDYHGNVGVNDSITKVDSSLAAPVPGGGRVAYSVNIYRRLIGLIQRGYVVDAGTQKITYIDPSANNYEIQGVFFGPQIWGDSVVTSQWDNFSLVVSP